MKSLATQRKSLSKLIPESDSILSPRKVEKLKQKFIKILQCYTLRGNEDLQKKLIGYFKKTQSTHPLSFISPIERAMVNSKFTDSEQVTCLMWVYRAFGEELLSSFNHSRPDYQYYESVLTTMVSTLPTVSDEEDYASSSQAPIPHASLPGDLEHLYHSSIAWLIKYCNETVEDEVNINQLINKLIQAAHENNNDRSLRAIFESCSDQSAFSLVIADDNNAKSARSDRIIQEKQAMSADNNALSPLGNRIIRDKKAMSALEDTKPDLAWVMKISKKLAKAAQSEDQDKSYRYCLKALKYADNIGNPDWQQYINQQLAQIINYQRLATEYQPRDSETTRMPIADKIFNSGQTYQLHLMDALLAPPLSTEKLSSAIDYLVQLRLKYIDSVRSQHRTAQRLDYNDSLDPAPLLSLLVTKLIQAELQLGESNNQSVVGSKYPLQTDSSLTLLMKAGAASDAVIVLDKLIEQTEFIAPLADDLPDFMDKFEDRNNSYIKPDNTPEQLDDIKNKWNTLKQRLRDRDTRLLANVLDASQQTSNPSSSDSASADSTMAPSSRTVSARLQTFFSNPPPPYSPACPPPPYSETVTPNVTSPESSTQTVDSTHYQSTDETDKDVNNVDDVDDVDDNTPGMT